MIVRVIKAFEESGFQDFEEGGFQDFEEGGFQDSGNFFKKKFVYFFNLLHILREIFGENFLNSLKTKTQKKKKYLQDIF